jgi:hypothetical protein
MKIATVLLASALLLPAASAFAQSFTFVAPAADLQELAGCYAAAKATATTPTAGSVTYFGVVPTHDAGHEQFARLRQALAASQATVLLYEKPDMGVDSTEAATIGRLGETGYVRFLAQQRGVRAERFDNRAAEYEHLRTRVEPTQLKLYYLLEASEQFRKNTGASKALTVRAMQQLIQNSASFVPGTEHVIRSLAEFEAAYRQHCPTGGAWWQRSVADSNLQAPASRPTEAFVQAINDSLRTFRTQRLRQKVAEKVQAGERVLVVLHGSQLPAPATYAVGTRASH